MNIFETLIAKRAINGKLSLTENEKDVLLNLAETGFVSLSNNEVKLEKDISLITEHCKLENVYFCEALPFLDCYAYIFTSKKPVLLTKYNYTKSKKYQKSIEEINTRLYDKNKFAILTDMFAKPENKQCIYTIKKVLATKNKNYLIEHIIDTDKLFQTNIPFK